MNDETKKVLPDNEMAKVNGGWQPCDSPDEWPQYTDKTFTVRCPKCHCHSKTGNIYYQPGNVIFGNGTNYYWCKNCGEYFRDMERDEGGCNNDW